MKLRDYEILYDLPAGEYDGHGIDGVRTVTIRAGRSLEVLCHPIVRRWPEAARAKKEKPTKEAMQKINARNLELEIMRLSEMNFTHGQAMVFTGTYEYPNENDVGMMNIDDVWKDWRKRRLPEGVEDVRRDMRNFMGRVRRRMEDPKALKWILRIEEDGKLEAFGLPARYHVHLLIEAGAMNQDALRELWPYGFTRCDRFDLKHDGAARIARYITKEKKRGRWVSHSRNLKKPEPRVSERRVSRRRLSVIAQDVQHEGRGIFEKLYPGYKVAEDIRVTWSDYLPGAFIYCRMRLID